LGGQLLSLGVLVVGTRLVTELVDGDTFGKARLAVGVAGLVAAVLVRPISQYAMRGYHEAVATGAVQEFERFARRSNVAAGAGSALLAAALWMVYGAWTSELSWLLAIGAGAYVLGEARWSLERSLLVTRDRQLAASALDVVMQVLLTVAAVGGILISRNDAAALVGAQALALVVAGAWFGRASHQLTTNNDSGDQSSMTCNVPIWRADAISFVMPLTIVSIASWFVNVGDRYLLDQMNGPQTVGHYAAVYGLCSAPLMACSGFLARLLYSTWFERAARGRRDDDLFGGMLALAVVTAVTALLAIWALGDIVASVALAADYRTKAGDLMIWIVAGYGLLVIAAPFEMRVYSRKATWVLGLGWGTAAVVNLVLNISWIPVWGAGGAARATLASFAVYLAVLCWGTARVSRASTASAGRRA
jgi:O-antigen/teichoic acid export membrane protein